MAAAISHGSSGGMADVGPHLVMAEPGTQLVQGPEVAPISRNDEGPLLRERSSNGSTVQVWGWYEPFLMTPPTSWSRYPEHADEAC